MLFSFLAEIYEEFFPYTQDNVEEFYFSTKVYFQHSNLLMDHKH